MKLVFFILALYASTSLSCEVTVRFESYTAANQSVSAMGFHGLDVDFARALLDSAGCSYQFISLPWARAIEMMKLGKIDMMTAISDRPERHLYMNYIGPQRNEKIVFAMDKKSPLTITSLMDIMNTPQPVAIHTGAYYGEQFNTLLTQDKNHHQFVAVVDNSHKVAMLRQGRISGFLDEKYNLIYQMKHNYEFKDITISPFIINSESVYFAFSKFSQVNNFMPRLKRAFLSSEYQLKRQQILKKYQLE